MLPVLPPRRATEVTVRYRWYCTRLIPHCSLLFLRNYAVYDANNVVRSRVFSYSLLLTPYVVLVPSPYQYTSVPLRWCLGSPEPKTLLRNLEFGGTKSSYFKRRKRNLHKWNSICCQTNHNDDHYLCTPPRLVLSELSLVIYVSSPTAGTRNVKHCDTGTLPSK